MPFVVRQVEEGKRAVVAHVEVGRRGVLATRLHPGQAFGGGKPRFFPPRARPAAVFQHHVGNRPLGRPHGQPGHHQRPLGRVTSAGSGVPSRKETSAPRPGRPTGARRRPGWARPGCVRYRSRPRVRSPPPRRMRRSPAWGRPRRLKALSLKNPTAGPCRRRAGPRRVFWPAWRA